MAFFGYPKAHEGQYYNRDMRGGSIIETQDRTITFENLLFENITPL